MSAGLDAAIFYSHGCKLLGGFYRAAADTPRPTVLLCHGVPGVEKNLDLCPLIDPMTAPMPRDLALESESMLRGVTAEELQQQWQNLHFVGVHPEHRRASLGRALYERFFELARARGAREVRCITAPAEGTDSIAFHTRIGFVASDPIPDYDGPGDDGVTFKKRIG